MDQLSSHISELFSNKNFLEAISVLESYLDSVTPDDILGREADVSHLFYQLVTAYNNYSVDLMKGSDHSKVIKYLKKAESICLKDNPLFLKDKRKTMLAVTFNNIAIYFKSNGRIFQSYSYLKKALDIETNLGNDAENPAGTLVNATVTLVSLKRYRDADAYAMKAIKLLENTIKRLSDENNELKKEDIENKRESQKGLLIVALYNRAVCQEHLGDEKSAIEYYRTASEIAESESKEHPLLVTLKKILKSMDNKNKSVSINKKVTKLVVKND